MFQICNFWAISTCNTSNKHIFHIEFNFKPKKYDLVEKRGKINSIYFFSKLPLTNCLWLQMFQISGRKFQNWAALCFGKVLKIKVIIGELNISNHVETADRYLLGGRGGLRSSFLHTGLGKTFFWIFVKSVAILQVDHLILLTFRRSL